uniref:4-(cytidine 5'-diphospho)-2-C-methyl-D-erythritol kinase n=1 Tax=Odontella aurita TaxID=265563 RepID=A0A7S4J8U2_9STRA|eukprot:CAMPEP_0113583242 /NCGR_PEP_ID=MMETSP0015_2-20120614/32398_1 /TAXON_ID=2838 /ORGANISM="Odontella" /LENGTH=378 /DNA_ID=CAMNT_0000488077 /DNA_START=15 /DNA_END=1151 /DNA_ORIENTATION=- /assembly_acc=CAM_ASM_000160
MTNPGVLFLVAASAAAAAAATFSPAAAFSPAPAFGTRSAPALAAPASPLSVSADDVEVDPSDYDLALFSPCKINLFLRIIRKRPDGFHDLASLFQTVGFGDTLYLTKLPDDEDDDDDDAVAKTSDGDKFECNMEGVPTDRTNLVLRALDLVREKTGNADARFEANLVKRVPAQAGLGGGSGNAAAAMHGANELLGRPATHEQLVEWSADLGSDITFFLSHGTAYCTGRGEIMTPINAPFDFTGETKLTIVKPDIGLSTPAVFGALDYDALSDEDPEELLSRFLEYGVDAGGDDAYVNDLEQPAFDCLPELRKLKEELLEVKGFDHVMMSGSGTSIFCMGEPDDEAGFMKEFGDREGLSVFPTEFISREKGVGCWFEER